MTRTPTRIGLVGAGSIAQIAELPALAASSDAVIAGVVTKTSSSARENAARWPIEGVYPTFDDMLAAADLDAVFVLTPKRDHVAFVKAGLQAGLDVFCEKPLTTDLVEGRQLAKLADETGQLLMVGFNRRYAEVYERAKAQFGEDGPDFCIVQKNRPGSEYRATLENAIHMIDLLRWFCGEAEEVTAHTIFDDPYEEKGTVALIRFKSGAVGSLVAARNAGEWDEKLDAYHNETSVHVTAPDLLAVSKDGRTELTEMRPRAYGWATANVTMGFKAEVDHFLERVRDREQPRTNGHEAVRTQELVYRILEAAGLPLDDRDEGDLYT